MFEEILNLPAHPLIVHAAVILVPLLIVVAAAYAVLPFARGKLEWAVVALAVVAPGAAFVAKESGEAFERRLAARDMLPPELAAAVEDHAHLADQLFWFVLALGVAALVLVAVQVRARRVKAGADAAGADDAAGSSGKSRGGGLTLVATVVLAIAVFGLGAATGWYVFQTGHTGAEMVWDGQ